jgi:hypothetical protein
MSMAATNSKRRLTPSRKVLTEMLTEMLTDIAWLEHGDAGLLLTRSATVQRSVRCGGREEGRGLAYPRRGR